LKLTSKELELMSESIMIFDDDENITLYEKNKSYQFHEEKIEETERKARKCQFDLINENFKIKEFT
jgi:hypothetical protein